MEPGRAFFREAGRGAAVVCIHSSASSSAQWRPLMDRLAGRFRTLDCLHDMGDPVGAARHVRKSLAPGGAWMLVEPFANDRLEDTINPVGRLYYSASTLLCTPASLSQEVGLALGAQAREKRLREVLTQAGFTRVRRVAQTPANMILEVRA